MLKNRLDNVINKEDQDKEKRAPPGKDAKTE
jgi:hypothetical protein